MGAACIRHSLRPPRFEGDDDASLGHFVPRECRGVAAIFARPILRDAASRLLRMRLSKLRRSQTLMVRSTATPCVSNHVAPMPA